MTGQDSYTGAYVALGSNVGDRAAALVAARRELEAIGELGLVSSVYETEPWGVDEQQAPYLNQVCRVVTALPPRRLVAELQEIESRIAGSKHGRNAPRVIDLDLLLYGDVVMDERDAQIPHPRMHKRAFVLVPLADIAPDLRHPVSGRTAREMLDGVDTSGIVRVTED